MKSAKKKIVILAAAHAIMAIIPAVYYYIELFSSLTIAKKPVILQQG